MAETQREPVPTADTSELETGRAFLEFARRCVLKKLDGLDEEQLRVELPSGTNLIGMVHHLAVSERYWFGWHVAGTGADDDRADFTMAVPPGRSTQDVLADYRAACAESDAIVERVGDPDALTARPVGEHRRRLRWVLVHMTTETTRHAGHADVIREQLDGTTGR
ncbi:DinB family protein [Angustibacter peucedani]